MLDNRQYITSIDKKDIYKLLVEFPSQLKTGTELADKVDYTSIEAEEIRNIVLLGMGGSAIGGDLNRAYLIDQLKVPFQINRTYDLPEFVDHHTLVLISSYSGNTEETLSAFNQAIERNAQIVAVSSNGKVSELSEKNNYPLVTIPGGLPPRASLGLSFAPIIKILSKLGLVKNHDAIIEECVNVLKANLADLSLENPSDSNIAKKIAKQLHKKLPIIYTSNRFWNSVGVRLRGQICENAKTLAYTAELPEMNHNELVGWDKIEDFKDILSAVFIWDDSIHPRVRYRMEFVIEHLKSFGIEPIIIKPKSEKLLVRIFEVVQLCDFISYYLAMLNGVDPEPIDIIIALKNKLAVFEEEEV